MVERKYSICILTLNHIDITQKCLLSVMNTEFDGSAEIIIVDNGSTDGTAEWLKSFQDKYDSLKADERRLDRLFEKTCYAKEIDEMAAALVESFISHLSSRDDLEKAAVTVAEGIKDYSTGKRGR